MRGRNVGRLWNFFKGCISGRFIWLIRGFFSILFVNAKERRNLVKATP